VLKDSPKWLQRSTEPTWNRNLLVKKRKRPFDLRAANTIGFLAGTLLKALDECRIEERLSNLEAAVTGNTDAKESFEFKTLTESHHEQSPSSSENN
jgi:hypothetical protein